MVIESTKKGIQFTLPVNTNIDDLQDFIDWLDFNTIAKKSKVKQSVVDELVSKIKKGSWDKRRSALLNENSN